MTKIKEGKIADLIQDDRNLNKGTEEGRKLIEKSLRKFGAGRSVLIDKNNRIIAGNKTHENAEAIGMDDVIIVETDGRKLVAVKRTDIDLDSPEGREMALADNATVKVDLEWDTEQLESIADDFGINIDEWDALPEAAKDSETEGEPQDGNNFRYETQYGVIVMCSSDSEQEEIYNKLTGEGYSCKVVSV